MAVLHQAQGRLTGGLPYDAIGSGPPVVVLQSLTFENRALTKLESGRGLGPYRLLAEHRRVYVVNRRPGMARGTSLSEMADDYAGAIESEFEPPVDVIGNSSGACIAFYLAAEHPQLVRRLVIQDGAPRMTEAAREFSRALGSLAEAGDWNGASRLVIEMVQPQGARGRLMARLFAPLMAWTAPDDPTDLLALLEAEERHDFTPRLGEISAPTLVLSGELDPFCGEAMVLEMAVAIPDARAIVYPGERHGVRGSRLERDLVDFLVDGPMASRDEREPQSTGGNA